MISNHFPCKDFESSNWWPTIKNWLALEFQVYLQRVLTTHNGECELNMADRSFEASAVASLQTKSAKQMEQEMTTVTQGEKLKFV